jgi:penicillin G amidase
MKLSPTVRTDLVIFVTVIALLLFARPIAADATERETAALASETIEVNGLTARTEIQIDRWGVPHIYAASQDDAFFTQGFNAARDRLFQIDLWRRRGLGELAAVFGASYLEQDLASRLFLYRGDMQKEWRAYGNGAERIATQFAAGINAYIDFLTREPHRLPFEFKHFGYAPAKWQAADVVRIRSHGLTRNVLSEVARSNVACKAGLTADRVRMGLQPKWETKLPEGLDPCLPSDVLRVFQLATQGVTLSTPPGATTAVSLDVTASPEASMEGSNAWVIAPSKSATGRAILANDPHRAYTLPALRYIARQARV